MNLLEELAGRQLCDYCARQPGTRFAEPDFDLPSLVLMSYRTQLRSFG
jgi:hypothetical protein